MIVESVKLPQNNSANFINRYGLTRDDLRNVRDHVAGIKYVIPMRNLTAETRYGSETSNVRVCGTDENFSHKLDPDQIQGRFLLEKDVQHFNNVAVIGDRAARDLFGNRNPVGRNVRVGRDYYLIVGRLDSAAFLPQFRTETSPDHSRSLFIPISTMRVRFGDDTIVQGEGSFTAESYQLSHIEIVPEVPEPSLKVWNSIQSILKAAHSERDYKLRIVR